MQSATTDKAHGSPGTSSCHFQQSARSLGHSLLRKLQLFPREGLQQGLDMLGRQKVNILTELRERHLKLEEDEEALILSLSSVPLFSHWQSHGGHF